MNGRDLVGSVKLVGSRRGLRAVGSAWRRAREDARALPGRGPERARVPGPVTGAEPGPGGGVVRFARSELRIRVAVGGAVFWGWDGAEPGHSSALEGEAPAADSRVVLEPGTDGGWQVVAERLTVTVSRHGAVELRTPGGVVLRRELPPRWWEPVAGGDARWVQRSEVPADARFFGLGGPAAGPRLRDGVYALGNTVPGGRSGPVDGPPYPTMPVQLVVADAGTHLVFYDNCRPGRVSLREGQEGAGSGHDRRGASEVRVDGGPLRCWAVAGTPARVLAGWSSLTGAAPAPAWARGVRGGRGPAATGWPGLRASLARVLGLGLCGVPYSGSDVGGFDGSPSPELYLRWLQLGAYLPLFRTHAAIDAGRREPWESGAEVLAAAREVLLERERLRPYWVTLERLAALTGAPCVRPLWWAWPGDRALRDCEDAFLLGDALLVAPVLEPGVVRRAVRLPPGRWYDTVSGAVYQGPGRVVVEAPLSRVPVLARAGAVIPVRGAGGGPELEVWAPVAGRPGGGTVVREAGDGRAPVEVERYTSRLEDGRVVVERDGGAVNCPVRVRGAHDQR
ncbi:glycosyl hydrolase [Streptomyces sp. 130]|uniref:glycoside hydrolase family 31 protein n=1 Tax=Streptomyces sp. 130 TaxID=2591006 RepID=UPI00117CFD7A|nr:glycoside hydrolase family 31 protein [Streptomyces sp. 130]TRV74881.1 glycosyl hydrolase [Streptomyces sp. 130]